MNNAVCICSEEKTISHVGGNESDDMHGNVTFADSYVPCTAEHTASSAVFCPACTSRQRKGKNNTVKRRVFTVALKEQLRSE